MKTYLPIGTLVQITLKNHSYYSVIIGYKPQTDKEQFDYMGVYYPIGALDTHSFLFYNEEEIEKIIHNGYDCMEYRTFLSSLLLSDDLNKLPDIQNS